MSTETQEGEDLFGEGSVDASASIPEVSEAACADENQVTRDNVSAPFTRPVEIYLTPLEIGEKNGELVRLYNQLTDIEEKKKASNKAFGEQIKDIRKKLDYISRVCEDGYEEQPIECVWKFDYEHCQKHLVRTDTDETIETKTLTEEELQLDFNHQLEQSVANAEALGKESAEEGESDEQKSDVAMTEAEDKLCE